METDDGKRGNSSVEWKENLFSSPLVGTVVTLIAFRLVGDMRQVLHRCDETPTNFALVVNVAR